MDYKGSRRYVASSSYNERIKAAQEYVSNVGDANDYPINVS